jgi:hypothetical protein
VIALKNPDPLMRRASAGSKHGQIPLSDKVKVPKERILPGESPFRAGAALKRTLVSCAERPAVDGSPAGELEHLPPLPYLHQPSTFCLALGLLENRHASQAAGMAKEK